MSPALMVERHRGPLLEYRSDSPDGSRFRARVLRYGVKDDYATAFRAGLFGAQLRRGDYPPLLYGHDWMSLSNVLGRAVDYEDTPRSLDLAFRLDVAENAMAKQAAGQLRSGTLSEFSIGFTRLGERPHATLEDTVEITEGFLDEVSIVPRGAVPGTELLAMRRADHERLMGMAPEARSRALANHVVGPGEVPAEVARQVVLELGAGLYGLDEGLRRLRASAVMPSLPPDLEAEVRSALEVADRFRPASSGLQAAAEAEAASILAELEDRDL